jgi:L-asparagine transporter-like permease
MREGNVEMDKDEKKEAKYGNIGMFIIQLLVLLCLIFVLIFRVVFQGKEPDFYIVASLIVILIGDKAKMFLPNFNKDKGQDDKDK